MYNKTLKNQYIQHCYNDLLKTSDEINIIVRAFKRIEQYELLWQKDLCEQEDDIELQKVVDDIKRFGHNKFGMIIELRDYVKWSNGIKASNNNSFLYITSKTFEKQKLSSVSGPDQLQKYLSAIYRPEIEHTIDNIYRAFYWLAFAGLEEKNAYLINADDIDIINMGIMFNGSKYPIYKEGVPAIESCKNDNCFVYYNDAYNNGPIERSRMPGTSILRGVKSTASMENRIMRTVISRKEREATQNGQIALSLSYMKVWKSGMFYREYQDEKSGNRRMGFERQAEIIIEDGSRSYKNGESATVKEKTSRIARDLLNEYIQWKIAHNL